MEQLQAELERAQAEIKRMKEEKELEDQRRRAAEEKNNRLQTWKDLGYKFDANGKYIYPGYGCINGPDGCGYC